MEKAERTFRCYDRAGDEHAFRHEIDLTDALQLAGDDGLPLFSLNKPGEGGNAAGYVDPNRDYERKSTDDIRKLCVSRGVLGYKSLTRGQQIEALQTLDKRDDELRAASAKASSKAAAPKVGNPTAEDARAAANGEPVKRGRGRPRKADAEPNETADEPVRASDTRALA